MISLKLNNATVKIKLSKLAEKLADFSEPLEQVGNSLIEYFGGVVFEQMGANHDWPMLAPSTIDARLRRRGYYANQPVATNTVLVWTGIMKNSFYQVVEPKRLVLGNEDPKFAYHQLGSANLPARPMFAINEEVLGLIKPKIESYAKSLKT